jgi:hypothetical protein
MIHPNALGILTAVATRYAAMAAGPVERLGVGFEPTEAEENGRRAWYARSAAHLIGPLSRKLERATTPSKFRRLLRQVARHNSNAAYDLMCLPR